MQVEQTEQGQEEQTEWCILQLEMHLRLEQKQTLEPVQTIPPRVRL